MIRARMRTGFYLMCRLCTTHRTVSQEERSQCGRIADVNILLGQSHRDSKQFDMRVKKRMYMERIITYSVEQSVVNPCWQCAARLLINVTEIAKANDQDKLPLPIEALTRVTVVFGEGKSPGLKSHSLCLGAPWWEATPCSTTPRGRGRG